MFSGTDVTIGHETHDTLSVTLTNQGNPDAPGEPGNIAFQIYNTQHEGSYVVDAKSCIEYMEAPINQSKRKRDGVEYMYLPEKRDGDVCYGKKNDDYEGGYWKVDGVGAFGSEVYKAMKTE